MSETIKKRNGVTKTKGAKATAKRVVNICESVFDRQTVARYKRGMSIGPRIIAARQALGWDQTSLAKILEAQGIMTQQTLSRLETGVSSGTRHIARLAEVLGVRAIWLEVGEEPMRYGDEASPQMPERLTPLAVKILNLEKQGRLSPPLLSALEALIDAVATASTCPPHDES